MALMVPLVLVGGMVISILLPDAPYSSMENRPLEQMPALNASAIANGKFQAQAQASFSDQFPGREFFIHGGYAVKKLLGICQIDDVYLGNGVLIQQPYSPDNAIIDANTKAIQTFKENNNINTLAMLVPTAAQIQSSRLPWKAPAANEQKVIDQVYQNLEGVSTNIPVSTALSDHKDEYIYYRTDHHWTSKGAYYGFCELIKTLGFTAPEEDQYDIYMVDSDFTGSLARKTGSINIDDQIHVYADKKDPQYVVTYSNSQKKTTSIYDTEALSKNDSYEVFLGANQGLVTIESDSSTGRNLLLFKDSYANSMIQFLLPYFDSIVIVDPRMYYEDLKALISQSKITDALFLYNYNNFVSDESLSDLMVSTYQQQEEPAN